MKILVVGDAILDHYLYGNIERVSPEDSSVNVVDALREEFRLGGCLNVSANIESLCRHSVSVASLLGRECMALMHNKCIDCQPSIRVSDGIKKTRIINSETNKQLIRLDNKKILSGPDLSDFHFYFEDLYLNHYDAVVVSDYNKGIVTERIIKKIASSFMGPVFIDTKKPDLSIWRPILHKYIKINSKEFKSSVSWEDAKTLIVTDGEAGCKLWKDGEWLIFPTEHVENPEVTGAGDVFLAGLVVEYMRTGDLDSALHFANEAATESTKHHGTVEVKI